MTTKKPQSLYPKQQETQPLNVNGTFIIALIGIATMHYPSLTGVI